MDGHHRAVERRFGTELGLQAALADASSSTVLHAARLLRSRDGFARERLGGPMFDYQTLKLMHRHGDDGWGVMAEQPHHDQAAHDPERALLKARVFRCTSCDEVVYVADDADVEGEPAKG
jgi:hypothetical protein